MTNEELLPTTQRNMDAAITHLRATTQIWSQRRMHGEFSVRLKFVNGVALQWEAIQAELHKTGQDCSATLD